MTIPDILKRLQEGNQRFVEDKLDGKLQDKERKVKLVEGQNPYAILLSCADSRVVPELTFDVGLGEIFTVRVAGNIANTSSIASIEYAVANIGCQVIIVLGHQNCGAVTAAVKGGDYGHNLNMLLAHINPAIVSVGKDAPINDVVKKNAFITGIDLVTRSKIIREAVEEAKVQIIPAYYNLDSGKVDFL